MEFEFLFPVIRRSEAPAASARAGVVISGEFL